MVLDCQKRLNCLFGLLRLVHLLQVTGVNIGDSSCCRQAIQTIIHIVHKIELTSRSNHVIKRYRIPQNLHKIQFGISQVLYTFWCRMTSPCLTHSENHLPHIDKSEGALKRAAQLLSGWCKLYLTTSIPGLTRSKMPGVALYCHKR